ncbi:Uncharacterized protein Anas_07456 [Armadillidium nasatum]|uniref:Peptidase M16 C-terminal domain-containing protein n=1 Tax=Armadillidium nasatum TaxID=96803 RepID=A0A5N5SM67_9CRUS|nr:Uncharacterized protein Anas_07456 [Armadillidium nasatum]
MNFIKICVFALVFCGFVAALFATLLPQKHKNFQLLCETKSLSGDIPVYKFKSLRTGLHVILAKIEGPTVHGYFTIGTDHTAYTVETAGKDGFMNLLPIYLEHLLYPTLTDSGFITEVYHITGKGLDAGVVYSEMQARENTGSERTHNELIRILYPSPSGYRYETGGMLANLRNNITNEKIREYHKAMYRPENLYVIITGDINS